MSIPKKVLFIGLGILALGIVVITLGLLQPPALWQAFQCGYDVGINNSSLTGDQISEYCNNQIQETDDNLESGSGLITVGFGIIFIVIGLIITGIGAGIWLVQRTRRRTTIIRRERTEAPSAGPSIEMMSNRGIEEEEDDWFTPKKVLAYCLIVGLISGVLSIFIDLLGALFVAAIVFAIITVLWIIADYIHRWNDKSKEEIDKHII